MNDRLKELRQTWGKSQKEMATITGVSLNTWQRIESGVLPPKAAVLQRLAEEGVDVNWVLLGVGAPMRHEGAPRGLADAPVQFEARGTADLKLVRECVEAVEETLEALGKPATPAERGELVVALYRLTLEERAKGREVPSIATIAKIVPLFRKLS